MSTGMVVQLTTDELKRMLGEAVAEAMSDPMQVPALLTCTDLARKWQCSEGMIRRFRAEGMPTVWMSESPRFDLDECNAWIKARPKGKVA